MLAHDHLLFMQILRIFVAPPYLDIVRKSECLSRTAKDRLCLVIYTSPEELQRAMARFQHRYNRERYHEALGNLCPVDVYEPRAEQILGRRKEGRWGSLRRRSQYKLALANGTG